jgi:hypothetical protein
MNEGLLKLAIQDNADFCDRICRAHGLSPQINPLAWTSAARTPNLFPDAITLSSVADTESILSVIDDSSGCSIKDSFAALDLHAYGFSILFEASWIGMPPGLLDTSREKHDVRWERVGTAAEFEDWFTAWSKTNKSGALLPELLKDPAFDFLWARQEDRVLGGAIANHSDGAVGISNFFTNGPKTRDVWKGCVDYVSKLSPNRPVVGYLENSSLNSAELVGFRNLGPLRIWVKKIKADPSRTHPV